ncbi:hypothetical protein ACEPAH_3136 [Sanghuangporus vaninii]
MIFTGTSSANATPSGTATPTITVAVPGPEVSRTVVPEFVWLVLQPLVLTTPSTSTPQPYSETEDDSKPDAVGDVEMATAAVGASVTRTSDALDVDMDAHVIINTADDGVADGIVALEQSVNDDDLATGAPPDAPGAIDTMHGTRANTP